MEGLSQAEAVSAYHRLLEADPAAAVEQAAWLESAFTEAGITFGGAHMRSFLRPHLVERAAWERLRQDGRLFLGLAVRVARRAFGGDAGRLCAWLGVPAPLARWVEHDPGPDVVLSRLDAFLCPAGPRFIEVNSDAPAGFGYADRMAEVFGRLPVFRQFARGRKVSHVPSAPSVVRAVLAAVSSTAGAPTVAIADWAEVTTRADQEILRQAFAAAGVPCLLADPRQMEVRGGRLWAGEQAVDVVYRRAVLSELVEREDSVRPFLRAYREGLAVFVNSFRCHLSEDKAFLALLSDEDFAALLTAEERALVERLVPWTRKLEERRTVKDGRAIDLLPFVLENRERLVLKPSHGYGGRAVLVGSETEPSVWEEGARAGLGAAWVVQERVPIPEEPFPICGRAGLRFEPLKVNANPFYVAGQDAGGVSRASRTAVINVSAGGGSVPLFVLD